MISLVLLPVFWFFSSAHCQVYPLVCAPLTSTGPFFESGLFLFFRLGSLLQAAHVHSASKKPQNQQEQKFLCSYF